MIKSVFAGRAKRHYGIAAFFLIAVSVFAVHAADDDDLGSTNWDKRPIEELFKTDVVYPQEKGELEVEVASLYQNQRGGDSWTAPLSLEYGLTDNWQVESEWDSFTRHRSSDGSVASGIGDLELGTQYSFMNVGGSLFHIAPRFSIGIPLGNVNKELSEGFLEYEPAVIVARDFPQLHRTQVFAEIGAGFVQRVKRPVDADDAEPAAHELNLGTGFFTLFAHGAATFEFNCNNNTWNRHGTENDLYATPGAILRVARNVEIGLGIPIGLNKGSDRFDVMAHVVWEF